MQQRFFAINNIHETGEFIHGNKLIFFLTSDIEEKFGKKICRITLNIRLMAELDVKMRVSIPRTSDEFYQTAPTSTFLYIQRIPVNFKPIHGDVSLMEQMVKDYTFYSDSLSAVIFEGTISTPHNLHYFYDEVLPLPKPFTINTTDLFITDFRRRMDDENTKDIALVVGTHTVKAHKFILETRSPVLSAMLNNDTTERKSNKIVINDFSFDVVCGLVEFLYTDECGNLHGKPEELLKISDKYSVEGLKLKAANELLRTLDIDNALDLLVMFDQYTVKELKDGLIKFVIVNRKKLFKTDDAAKRFKEENPQLSAEIFEKYFFNFDKGVTDPYENDMPISFENKINIK